MTRTRRWGAAAALLTAALGGGVTSPGCAEFDVTPVAVEHGTLGEEIVQVFCERMARQADPTDVSGRRWKPVCSGADPVPDDAPPRVRALMDNRERLAAALDATLPDDLHDDLGLFVGELLPFFDAPEERLPTSTRRLAEFLDRLSSDDDALAALERIGARQGYRPLRFALGVTRPTLAYPEFDELADVALTTLLEGSAREEFLALLSALALEMATLEPGGEESGPTTLELVRELMFAQSDAFAAGDETWVLRRDARGVALTDNGGGSVLAPFVDMNGDGLADVDPRGRFVDASGGALIVPSPFRLEGEAGVPRDPVGRALRQDGTRYFAYLDVSRTMLAGVTAELGPWFSADAPTLMQLSRGLPVLLGPQARLTRGYDAFSLGYESFDTPNGPMFDAVAAVGELLPRDTTTDALVITETLLRDHESATAGVIAAARHFANRSDRYPNARLTDNSILWDDLIQLLVRIAQEPGMLEAILRSFSDERAASLGAVYGDFMRNRDRVTYDPSNVNGPPLGLPLDEPVARSMPDTFDNESQFQRTLALIDGLNGVEVCNKAGARLNLIVELGALRVPLQYPLFGGTANACEIIRIDNVAEAYARAILGTYELELQSGFLNVLTTVADALGIDVDGALEASFGIDGLTRRPTPQALNRLVFWGLSDDSGVRSCIPDASGGNCNSAAVGQLFDPVVDRHGNEVIERFHGTIFAWEQPGFYEGMRPLLEVLHRPEYTYDFSGNYYFGDILGTLHQHWASAGSTETCGPGACSPGEPNFSYQSDARSYEALIADGLVDGELTARMQRLNVALESVEVRPGVDGVSALATAGEDLIDPLRNRGFTDRRGRSMTTANDGSRMIPMTPLYMLLEALAGIDTAWEAEPERRRDYLVARRAIAEQLLATEPIGADFRMANPRARAMLLEILPFTRARIDAHRTEGDLLEWSTGLDERLAETLSEPLLAALVRFLDRVNEDPDTRRALSQLLGYLVGIASDNDAFATVLYALADALMVLEDDESLIPLMRALSGGVVANIDQALVGAEASLDVEGSALFDSLDLVRDIQQVDADRTLRRVLQNAVAIPSAGDEVTPLETIIDVISEVNRATPGEGGHLREADYREVLGQTTRFIRDEDHGLERLNSVIQGRECFPENRRACDAEGSRIESQGSCYAGASCTCVNSDGALSWRCERP